MAKTNKPRKFRQARAQAKADAKKVFKGKPQARLKDRTLKVSADDRLALREMKDTAQKELGKKAYLSRAEYDANQRAAREAFRERMREEFGEYGKKMAEKPDASKKPSTKKVAAKVVAESSAKKKAVAKPTAEKKMTRAEKSAANKAKWAKMTPAERKNWSASKQGAAKPSAADKEVAKNTRKFGSTKPLKVVDTPVTKGGELEKKLKAEKTAAKKPIYNITNVQPEKAGKGTKKAKLTPKTGKAVVVRPKNPVEAYRAKQVAIEAAKKTGARGVATGVLRGAGKLVGGRVGALLTIGSLAAAPFLNRQDKEKKTTSTTPSIKPKPGSGTGMTPGSRPKPPVSKPSAGAGSAGGGAGSAGASGGAGGSSIKVTQGSTYTVKSGDTLSGIAKAAGVSLADLRKANKKFTTNAKYQQGKMIWSGTTVKIPKK
jgi:LysM repeat protein